MTITHDRDFLRRSAKRIDVVADRLWTMADEATPGPWRAFANEGIVSVQQAGTDDPDPVCTDASSNGPWIAAMSPVLVVPLVAWLRDAASCIREHVDEHDDVIMVDGGVLCANEIQAIEFADLLFTNGVL